MPTLSVELWSLFDEDTGNFIDYGESAGASWMDSAGWTLRGRGRQVEAGRSRQEGAGDSFPDGNFNDCQLQFCCRI